MSTRPQDARVPVRRTCFRWLPAILCFIGMPAFAQSFECYNYGSYSQCQMPNGSQLTCYNYGGSNSSCEVSHTNGFVSRPSNASGGAGGALILLVDWMAHKHANT